MRTRSLLLLKPVSGWPSVHPPEVTPVRSTSVGCFLSLRQPQPWSRATFGSHPLFEADNHSSLRTANSSFTPRTLLKSVSHCTLNLCSLPQIMMFCFLVSPGHSMSSDSRFTGLQLSATMFLGTLRTLHYLYFHVHHPQILLSSMLALTHSSILAWRIPGTEEPGGLLSMGSHRVGHDWCDLAAAAVCCPWLLNIAGEINRL